MRKIMKRIAAVLLAAATVLCGTCPAYAAANREIPITGISFPTSITMKVGEKRTLSVKPNPSNTTYKMNIQWGHQTNSRFTVKTNGYGTYWNQKSSETITAKKAGTGYLNNTVIVYNRSGKRIKTFNTRTTVKVVNKSEPVYTLTPETNPNLPVAPGADEHVYTLTPETNPDLPPAPGASTQNKAATGKTSDTSAKPSNTIDLTAGLNIYESVGECYTILNRYRREHGLKNLKRDYQLQYYAEIRAKELVRKYSHTRPNGKQGCDMIPLSQRTTGGRAAENIARGQRSCREVMQGWYNSAGHRRNMLNSCYSKVGIAGYRYNGTYYWVQLFA